LLSSDKKAILPSSEGVRAGVHSAPKGEPSRP
jgi:hypothetical protein